MKKIQYEHDFQETTIKLVQQSSSSKQNEEEEDEEEEYDEEDSDDDDDDGDDEGSGEENQEKKEEIHGKRYVKGDIVYSLMDLQTHSYLDQWVDTFNIDSVFTTIGPWPTFPTWVIAVYHVKHLNLFVAPWAIV